MAYKFTQFICIVVLILAFGLIPNQYISKRRDISKCHTDYFPNTKEHGDCLTKAKSRPIWFL